MKKNSLALVRLKLRQIGEFPNRAIDRYWISFGVAKGSRTARVPIVAGSRLDNCLNRRGQHFYLVLFIFNYATNLLKYGIHCLFVFISTEQTRKEPHINLPITVFASRLCNHFT